MPRSDIVGSAGPALQEAFDQGAVEPEEAFGTPEARIAPTGKWFVHARQGVPYQASENSDPDNVWRLVFNEAQLAEAYPSRKTEGYPILVDPKILNAPDWLQQFERARLDQYEHPDFQIDFQRLRGGGAPGEEPGPPVNSLLDGVQGSILQGRPALPPIEESFATPPPVEKRMRLARHERSETVQLPDGSFVNVFGRGTPREGEPLEPKFEFEKLRYGTLREAMEAARRRSEQSDAPATPSQSGP